MYFRKKFPKFFVKMDDCPIVCVLDKYLKGDFDLRYI